MAFELHRDPGLPCLAASAMAVNTVVNWNTGDVQRSVVAVATVNIEPVGITRNVASSAGDPVTVYDDNNVVRAVAIASLGAGADIGVASTNGGLAAISAASGTLKYRVGRSLTAAAAGETFSLSIKPRAISGNTP